MFLDPTALPSKETAVVVHLADAAVSVEEEEVDADLEVDTAVAVVDTEEEEVVVEEAATATSVVSPVTWRETVLKAVEVTEEAAVATEVEADTAEEVVVTEVVAVEVVAAGEAATAVASRDISPGIAPAVDVKTNAGYAVEKSELLMNAYSVSLDFTKPSLFTRITLSSQIPLTMATTVNKTVRVAAAQMTSVNDLMTNFATCSRLVQEAALAGAKLICFPENFSFVGDKEGESVKIAEPLDGPVMERYCSLARDSNIWLSLGGFQERFDDTHLCNTHVVIDDAGMIRDTYQKMHLFDVDVPGGSSYKESSFTVPGTKIVSVDSPVGRLGLTVCYDLRFPKIYQQLRFEQKAQVLLVPSAFTKVTGEAHWEILLRARAIETQCYVIAAAQAGKHNEKRESYGDTLIIDPWGTVVGRLPDRVSTGIVVADIDFSLIDSVRTKMPIDKQRVSIDL